VIVINKNNSLYVNISNLENEPVNGVLTVKHMRLSNDVLMEKSLKINAKPQYSTEILKFDSLSLSKDEYLYVELKDEKNNVISSSIYQQEEDKDIAYPKAKIEVKKIAPKTFKVVADAFSKDVFLDSPKDVTFSDNYFTLLKGQDKIVTSNEDVDEKDIKVMCINNL
jgi:hypothetical protein